MNQEVDTFQKSFLGWLKRNETILIVFFLFCLNVLIFIPLAPNIKFLDRDGSLFLFFGRSIVNGKVPYRDLWDHKGPVLYFINAFSQIISNRSIWGLWIVENIHLFLCLILLLNIFNKLFSREISILASIFFLSGFNVFIQGGNFTEEFSILPILISLIIISRDNDRFSRSALFIHGLLAGIVFFLRPNNIGFYISLCIAFTLTFLKRKHFFLYMLYFFLGVIVVSLFIFLYFWFHKGIPDFIDQLFLRNFFYSVSLFPWPERIQALINVFRMNFLILIPATFGWFNYLRKSINSPDNVIGKILVIDFPLEIFLLSISGRFFPHYFLCLLPSMTFFFCDLISDLRKNRTNIPIFSKGYFVLILGLILSIPLWQNTVFIRPFFRETIKYGFKVKTNDLIEFIKANTQTTDAILVWGHEPMIYLYSDRSSPTKYLYQQAFETPNYFKPEMLQKFCEDINIHPPKYIIDSRNPFPLAESKRDRVSLVQLSKYQCFFNILDEQYVVQKQVDQDYDIFLLKE